LSNIKNNYFESIKRKVDQEHIEKPHLVKRSIKQNSPRVYFVKWSQLNSTTHCWFSLSYVIGLLFIKKKYS